MGAYAGKLMNPAALMARRRAPSTAPSPSQRASICHIPRKPRFRVGDTTTAGPHRSYTSAVLAARIMTAMGALRPVQSSNDSAP